MSLSFLAPAFLWALLGLPLVVLLHFLRVRRRPLVVSALFLWRRASALADTRRRFSATWLLLLQLLFVALAALALARPVVSTGGEPDRVVIVDASASMAARDDDGARMDEARSTALSLSQGVGRVALVRAGLDAVVLSGLGADEGEFRAALSDLRAGDREADLQRALDLALALAAGAEVHLISDSPPPAGDFHFHPVGGDGINYGIVTFDVSLGQAYVALASTDPRPQELTLRLLGPSGELARSSVLIPAAGQVGVNFPLAAEEGFVSASLDVPSGDALSLDDVAFAGQRPLSLLVEEPVGPLLRALDALPAVSYRVSPAARTGQADVRILFGEQPDGLPDSDLVLFSEAVDEPSFLEIRDWAQSDELLRFVDLRNVVVGVEGDPSAVPADWEVLARTSDLRPVISRSVGADRTVLRFEFHPAQTDLVLRPAFPALVANLVDSFRGQTTVPLGSALPPGSTFEGQPAERALVPGVYRTPGGEVAANLLSAAQTRLPTAAEPRAGEVVAEGQQVEAGRALWAALIVLALVILLGEWLGWSRGAVAWLRR